MATNEEIRAKDILPHKTSFSAGDGFYGDGPQSFFMEAKDLVQNVLAGNLAPEFVPNSTTTVTGMPYMYNGSLYIAKENYQGAWDDTKFELASVNDLINLVKSSVNDINSELSNTFEVVHSANLFDEDWDETGYIKVDDGTDASSNDYKRTSKYYDLDDASTLYYVATSAVRPMIVLFYDVSKDYLGYTNFNNNITGNYNVPAGAKYFRLYTDVNYSGNVCFSKSYVYPYVPYEIYYKLLARLSENSVGKDNLKNEIADRTNLVDVMEDKKYLNYANGNIYSNVDGYRASSMMEVEASTDYYLGAFYKESNSPSTEVFSISVAFYDASKTYVSGAYSSGYDHINCAWENGMVKVTSPVNAAFAVVGLNDLATKTLIKFSRVTNGIIYSTRNNLVSNIINKNFSLQGKQVVVFGDSIMGNTRDITSTPANIAKACGATVHNFGFGGCRMSVHAAGWDNCSMYRLADNIYADDFSALVTAINTGWSGMPGYFKNTVAWLAALDFDTVDAIVISYGTNDYREETSTLDNHSDKFDTSTVCGALRYSIKKIQESHPKIQILVTCPIFRMFLDSNNDVIDDSDTKDWGSGTLIDYEQAYRQACAEMKVQYLDLYDTAGLSLYTRSYYYPADDGTHPNDKGRERLGTLIGNKLKALLCVCL